MLTTEELVNSNNILATSITNSNLFSNAAEMNALAMLHPDGWVAGISGDAITIAMNEED